MVPAPVRLPYRPCTLVVAAAGYGKTTTVRRLLHGATARWYSRAEAARVLDQLDGGPAGAAEPGAVAPPGRTGLADHAEPGAVAPPGRTGLADQAGGVADRPLWLVFDDVARLPTARLRAVLSAAERLPDRVRLVLLTRHPPPPATIAVARRRGVLGLLGPADLALTRDEVAAVLRDRHDLGDPALARSVYAATAGWPALVQLAARAIVARAGGEAEPIAAAGSPADAYLVREVFPELAADTRRVLRQTAHLDPIRAELIVPADPDRAERVLRRLVDVGLLRPDRSGGAGYQPIPLVAAAGRRCLSLPAAQVTAVHARAAAWYAEHGPPAAALRGYRLAGDRPALARLLDHAGAELVATGAGPAVIAAVDALPAELRSPRLRRLAGDARRGTGDAAGAIAVYAELAGPARSLPPALAWRHGLVHYLRGEPRQALAVFARARTGDGSPADEALLLGWAAMAYGTSGDDSACADRARRALALATETARSPDGLVTETARSPDGLATGAARSPDGLVTGAAGSPEALAIGATRSAEALAVAHVAAGLSAKLAGDRSAAVARLTEALRVARSAGNLFLQAWIRVNRAAALASEARNPEALAEAGGAVELAETIGDPDTLVLALSAEGGALARLGRLDEAMARYDHAVTVCQRTGSRQLALPLAGIGHLHLLRGRDSVARAAYEEAIRIAGPGGNLPALVPALAGLARVTAPAQPAEAGALAERAVRQARGPEMSGARCAAGWVAIFAADRSRAARLAEEAAGHARLHHDRAGLAEALELRAAAGDDPQLAREALTEAAAILRDAGARLAADRLAVLLGRLPGAGPTERVEARLATERLTGAGVPPPVPAGSPGRAARVAVHTLGRFEVLVAGRAVPGSAWQSRKARDLLRILAARRGRPIAREQVGELLWPGEEPGRVGHRLSVVLSILRGVLDPHRTAPADRYVLAERASLALDVEHVDLDVELFRAEALHGLRLLDRDDPTDAGAVLALAERRYLGDFLVDDPYDDWAVPVRDEARRLYQRVVRALATLARRAGDLEQAAHHLRRAVESDPYDERTYQELVAVLAAAGRHGEADETYRRYCRAMALIGVHPAGLADPREDLAARANRR